MTYVSGNRASPFSLAWLTFGTLTPSTRWNTTSQTWLNTNIGSTGLSFSGRGYVWCALSGDVTNNVLVSFSVGAASEPQYTWASCFQGGVAARSVSDDSSWSHGNSTEWRVKYNYYSGTTPKFEKLYSRAGVIRLARA